MTRTSLPQGDPKVAFITGGASGIGLSSALRLADDGFDVAILDTDLEGARRAAENIKAKGCRSVSIHGDVTSSSEVGAAIAEAARELGRLDFIFANAGVSHIGPILSLTDEQWHRTIDVDLHGVFYTIRAGARALVQQGQGGVILSTASAYTAMPGYGLSAYCAAKAGVLSITRCAAIELGHHNIRVNALGPGVIRTPMTNMQDTMPSLRESTMRALSLKRLGEPEEVAGLVAYLASDAASYITGHIFYIDGGFTLRGGVDIEVALVAEGPTPIRPR